MAESILETRSISPTFSLRSRLRSSSSSSYLAHPYHNLPLYPSTTPYYDEVDSPISSTPLPNAPFLKNSSKLGMHQAYAPENHEHFALVDELCTLYSDEDSLSSIYQCIEEEINFQKRELAVREIFSSELAYVQGLRKLRNIFYQPLLEKLSNPSPTPFFGQSKGVLTLDDFQAIFSNFDQILQLHEQFLEDLNERQRIWCPAQILGDLLLKTIPFFRMYIPYLKNFPQAVVTLERLTKPNSQFKKFLDACHENPLLENMNLESYLILPIQRIPRYKLLLEALLKFTNPLHPDFINLSSCASLVAQIAEELNEKIRDAENQRHVLELQKSIANLPQPLVAPHRRLILQGNMNKIGVNNTVLVEPRAFFLFNDKLIEAKFRNKNSYTFKAQIDLLHATVELRHPNCLQIRAANADKPLLVRANSEDERREWLLRITETIQALNQADRRLSSSSTFSVASSTVSSVISKTIGKRKLSAPIVSERTASAPVTTFPPILVNPTSRRHTTGRPALTTKELNANMASFMTLSI
ncbi:uncharacterized protein VTP21DRAFT_3353 [Calcarisporiella thermophila]|uniref:uncharacterized protein n=1 Tax=Calcarisporiella thermophila TaxID=911321 RepID=UPI0037436C0E